jgi:hypothetical protein
MWIFIEKSKVEYQHNDDDDRETDDEQGMLEIIVHEGGNKGLVSIVTKIRNPIKQ